MADQIPGAISTDEASTNFYWTCGEREIFNLQTTIRGTPDVSGIRAHLSAVKAALMAVVQSEGHAKPVGQQPSASAQASPSPSNGNSSFNEWTQRKGKTVLLLRGNAAEPNEIECPNHSGQKLKRRTNDRGSWLSHKWDSSPGGYCSVGIERT